MRLPEDFVIYDIKYTGARNRENLPHGEGVMEYFVACSGCRNHFKYEGTFRKGMRDGYGVLYSMSWIKNPVEEWQWYMEGEYDSAGRFVHPAHEPGSYVAYTEVWEEEYVGLWEDNKPICAPKERWQSYEDKCWELENEVERLREKLNMPQKPETEKSNDRDFEITEDESFLEHFLDYRDVRRLTPKMVEKLRNSDSAYGKYGYGQWLYRTHNDEESLKTATQCFRFAAENGVADALYMLSVLYFYGKAYDEEKKDFVFDRDLSHKLGNEAIEKGSVFGKLRRSISTYYGSDYITQDKARAISEAELQQYKPGKAALLWSEQLGWFYEDSGRKEKAYEAYTHCIKNGHYYPIHDIANMFLRDKKEEAYTGLMKEGMKMEIPVCYMLGIEKEKEWDTLDQSEQKRLHNEIKKYLKKGMEMNEPLCYYSMAYFYYYGKMGFEENEVEALKIVLEGTKFNESSCYEFAANILDECPWVVDELPREMKMSKDDILMLMLKSLRHDSYSALDNVIEDLEEYVRMGYGKEIENVWMPKWIKKQEEKEKEELEKIEKEREESKTPITPTIIVIQPSGIAEFVEVEMDKMVKKNLLEFIDAKDLDVLHFSAPLNKITNDCNIKEKRVALYADKESTEKNLPTNRVATILYGHAIEVKGPVIVTLENKTYTSYPFTTEEDLENVFDAMVNCTNGLLRLEKEEDDSKYDAWS